jgi:hypothetical protein
LTATTGKTLRIHLFSPTDWRDALIANYFYPGSSITSGDVDIDIETAATTTPDSTPVHDFVVFGHAGGSSMWGSATPGFTPSNFLPEDPAPTFGQAERGFLPRRCWFTRNATARAVGCNSSAFATDFTAAYLRRGSSITATTKSVRPHCTGLPNQIAALAGRPTDCAWYNQLAFTSSPSVAAPILAGPFSTLAGFHGAPFWTTARGVR